ncbi:MAG: 23S rRNA (guanosine(2251)-2'-O)-methyltransferase RlmB [Bacteroidales bacterium]|nr:23S rRNA (guanosine(2251)-2'-O)-methyltransferase RlmB [Bacteroidales bacterium]
MNATEHNKNKKHLIYGIRPVMEAIAGGKEIDKIILQRGLSGDLFKELFHLIRQQNIPFQYVPVERLNRYTKGNHQGVVCLMSMIIYQSIFDIIPTLYEEGKMPFILILDSLTDVRNIGSIARSAECAGVHAIIIPAKHTAQINEDAIKTSAGALHQIPVCRHDNLAEIIDYLQQSGVNVVACTEKAGQIYYEHDFNGPTCLVMGNEYEGISGDILNKCSQKVKIPMTGTIESLNVSVAAGVIMFEILRQRNIR